ncbi:MAG: hypothetical protein R3F19_04295 [Verrucomicrobiales bacterium]
MITLVRHKARVAEASCLSSPEDQRRDASATFATDDQDAYLDAWQSVDSDEGVPLAVANRVFGKDALKPIIEELNEILAA